MHAQARPAQSAQIGWSVLLGPVSLRTWRAVANMLVSLVTGSLFFVAVICALLLSGAVSWIVGLGMLVLSSALRLAARMARVDRWRIKRMTGVYIELASLPGSALDLSFRERQKAWPQSPAVRRLVAYQIVRLPVTAASLFAVGLAWFGMIAGLGNVGSPASATAPVGCCSASCACSDGRCWPG